MPDNTPLTIPAVVRVILSLILPVVGALVFALLVGSAMPAGAGQGLASLQLTGAGLTAWFVGLRWFGLRGLALRGHRALYAGIGFAVLAWLVFFVVRLVTVESSTISAANSGRTFIYLLLFEAFCAQLWAFGLFFRSIADWRGPLTAAVASGLLFGTVAFLTFQESYLGGAASLLFFILWGVLYGIIRLRTGSILGIVVIQALQSWTAWQIWVPRENVAASELNNLYLVSSLLYLIIIWRLWPKQEEDYRV